MTSPLYGMAHGGYMFYFDRQGGCEGYRTIFKETRKQWPRCSMAINWCYDKPWKTAGNNSIIEHPTTPKPCYDFIKDALRPALFSARIRKFSWSAGEVFDPELWLLNDSSEKISGTVRKSQEERQASIL